MKIKIQITCNHTAKAGEFLSFDYVFVFSKLGKKYCIRYSQFMVPQCYSVFYYVTENVIFLIIALRYNLFSVVRL